MPFLASITHVVGTWAHLYSESKAVSSGVTFVHLGGVLLGGGFAVATDRMTLRAAPSDPARRSEHLEHLHTIHRPVLIGLALTFITGVLMFAADIEVYLPAPLFWAKMAVIAGLLVNGAVLRRTEIGLRHGDGLAGRGWKRLRRSAWLSAFLWFGALFLGTALLTI